MKISIDAADKALGMTLQEVADAAARCITEANTNGTDPATSKITVIINFRGGIKTLQAEV